MKCRLLFTLEAGPSAPDDICIVEDGIRFIPEGTEIEHPQAYMLAHGGHAEASDDECRERVGKMDSSKKGLLRKVHKRILDEQKDFQYEQEQLESGNHDDASLEDGDE